jgi:hypothetical protein
VVAATLSGMADLMLRARRVAVEAQISENIAALCHRAGTNQTRVAGAIGLTVASMSRKMAGGPWLYSEVVTIAELLGVTAEELAGTLPSREEWRARRDSNPKPSVLWLIVNPGLTPESPPIRSRMDVPARHLRAV